MKIDRTDAYSLVAAAILCSTPVAFMSFEFAFPNVSFPSFGSNLPVILALSVLTGVPAGYLNKRVDLAMMAVIAYIALGYALAFTFYSLPFLLYHAQQVIPGLYYALFLKLTIILLFVFAVGGILGMMAGQVVRDSLRREETKVLWGEEPNP